MTPIDIPTTPDNYGIIHGDAHTGNWMLVTDPVTGEVTQTTIDFDNAEQNWYVVDIGTVVWGVNMQYYSSWQGSEEEYERQFEQYKVWFLDEY